MSVNDFDKARNLLLKGGYTCVLLKGAETFSSYEKGVAPLLKIIDSGSDFRRFSAADKIVGKAAALLYVHIGIKELYAEIVSESAVDILRQNKISLKYDKLVPFILNRKGDGTCPIEKSVEDTSSPLKAIKLIKEKIKNMSNR